MCADLQALIATKKEELEKELKQRMLSSSGPTPREDMKSILASMQAMIRRGEGIKQEAPQRKTAVGSYIIEPEYDNICFNSDFH